MKMKLTLGLMSGTSVDGKISVAGLKTNGKEFERLFTFEYEYEEPQGLRPLHHVCKAVEVAFRRAEGDPQNATKFFPSCLRNYCADVLKLDSEAKIHERVKEFKRVICEGNEQELILQDVVSHSTRVHIDAVLKALICNDIDLGEVDLIGFHGQTVFHDPFFRRQTIQLGDAQTMANELGAPTAFDFRSNDVAHGGQGAPLAPVYHRALLQQSGIRLGAFLNLGGTANLTVVSADSENILGFDTGPANGLIDRYVKEKSGLAMDSNSELALRGRVSQPALQALLERSIILKDGRNYLNIQPPKSLDIRDYVFELPEFVGLSLEDGCATLNAFTAECIARSTEWVKSAGLELPTKWILCGGGACSPHLCSQIRERLEVRVGPEISVTSADKLGWSAQGMEAELFAFLAARVSEGLPLTFPGTTGVASPLTGGRIVNPNRILS